MDTNNLYKEVSLFFNEFEINFLKLIKNPDGLTTIHDIRVSMKKITTLYSFLDDGEITSKKQSLIYTKLRKIFKTLGIVRECQINAGIISDSGTFNSYMLKKVVTHLEQNVKYNLNIASGLLKQFSLLQMGEALTALKQTCKSLSQKQIDQLVNEFIERRFAFCETKSQSSDCNLHLHDVRRFLKQIRFINELNLNSITIFTPNIIQLLKVYEKEMGLWHDYDIALQWLKSEGSLIFDNDNTRMMENLHNSLQTFQDKTMELEALVLKNLPDNLKHLKKQIQIL